MLYRPDIHEVVDRYKRFYACEEPGALLVHVFTPVAEGDAPPSLRDYRFPDLAENARYMDALLAWRERYLKGHLGVADDYVPDVYSNHGIGIHSAYVAGDIIFSSDTSWSHPVIENWDDLDRLTLSEDNPWFQVLRQSAEIMAERLRGKAGLATFYHFSPLDMANALRGNTLFLDLAENPSEVRRLLDFCAEAVIWLEERLWPIVGDCAGGAPLWGSWVPGHALMMSEDAANLCRAGDYAAWAAPWTQRITDHFGGALIHNHALGMHIQGEIAQVRGLRILQISEDPNQPRPIDHLANLIAQTGGRLALQVGCKPEELDDAISVARAGKVILQTWAPDMESANRLVAKVRKASRIMP